MAVSYIKKQVQGSEPAPSPNPVQSGDIDIDTSADHIGDDDMPTENELKLMREFTYVLKPRKGDPPDPHEPIRIDIGFFEDCLPLPADFYVTYTGRVRDPGGRITKQPLIIKNALPEPIWLPGGEMQWPAADLPSVQAPADSDSTYKAPHYGKTTKIGDMQLPSSMFEQPQQTDLEQATQLTHEKISGCN